MSTEKSAPDLLDRIDDIRLYAATKGLPLGSGDIRLGDVRARRWNVQRGDMSLPILVLRDARVRANLEIMRRYAEFHGVLLAPHGKTTCCPQLYRDQVRLGGAWGISAATVEQAALIAGSGIPNVLIANQIVGEANIKKYVRLRQQYPGTRFLTFVDSRESLEQLRRNSAEVLAPADRLSVLVEVGYPGGRSGVQTRQAGIDLVRLVAHYADRFELGGVGFYEGLIPASASGETIASVGRLVDSAIDLLTVARESQTIERPVLSAGGSAHFDIVVKRIRQVGLDPNVQVILRCGESLTSDHGICRSRMASIDERGGLQLANGRVAVRDAFLAALELWCSVVTVHNAGSALLNIGRRDLSGDFGYPTPLRLYRNGEFIESFDPATSEVAITAAYAHHAYVRYPDNLRLAVGDVFACGISHPSASFERWDVVYRVDEEFAVVEALKTFF